MRDNEIPVSFEVNPQPLEQGAIYHVAPELTDAIKELSRLVRLLVQELSKEKK